MRYTGAPERTVIAYEDGSGNPVDVSSTTALPVTGGGGGGGGSLSDTVFVDSTGQLFVYRDTGSGTPSAFAIPSWSSYTPVGAVRNAVSVNDPSATASFGPIATENTVLFAAVDTANAQSIQIQVSGLWTGGIAFQGSDDGTNYFSVQYVNFSDQQAVDTLYAPDTVVIPVTTRFFRAITTPDFVGSVSGVYALRFAVAPTPFVQSTMVGIDPQVTMPVGGVTPTGMVRRIAVADNGGVRLADGMVLEGTRSGIQPGTVLQFETTGYGSAVVQLVGTWTGTVTFQVSNDTTTWVAVNAWPVAGGATPVTTATAVGQWVIPASGRYFRVQITTAGTGVVAAVAVQKNFSAWMPLSSPTIGTVTTLTGGGVAEDAATTANPVLVGGVARTGLPASTVVAGDAIRATYSVSGQMVTKENAPGDLDFYINATVTTNTQTQLRAAQATGIRTNVTGLTFQNTSATATTLTIQDGAATTLITFSVPASMTLPVQLNFPTPLRGTAATALNYTAGTTGANILLNVIGFSSY